MVSQFHALVSTIYNGWVLFGCFAYTCGVYLFSLEKLVEKRMYRAIQVASAICVATAAYLLLIGVYQAIDWVNPFVGKGEELANSVHNPKGWLIITLIVVWPYVLIVVSLAMGFIGQREFRTTSRLLKARLARVRP
ncbi:hypothetical protein [Rhizobium leguminosarum]|uniref:hypothetical protein n=1 Tax=Rhizobium leguminosarum TaxID=384 RepID=UPI0012BD2601|nr:hypothetical protein [Rhizobium leguminosarum]WFT86767.1 hypothetical protein QA638_03875 [Rhizobium leguminosarum]